MGCQVSRATVPNKAHIKYKSSLHNLSEEVGQEDKCILYQTWDKPILSKDMPNFIIKKKAKKKPETQPVTFTHEYLQDQSPSPDFRNSKKKLTFSSPLREMPAKFHWGDSHLQKRLKKMGEEEDHVIAVKEHRRPVTQTKIFAGEKKQSESELLDISKKCVRRNYQMRWAVEPLPNIVLGPSMSSFYSNQEVEKSRLVSPVGSRELASYEELCHQLPYNTIKPKLLTDVIKKSKSEPRLAKKHFTDNQKYRVKRNARKTEIIERSIEEGDLPNHFVPDIDVVEKLKQKLKSTISIKELRKIVSEDQLGNVSSPKNKAMIKPNPNSLNSMKNHMHEGGQTSTEETPQKIINFNRQGTNAPLISSLVQEVSKRKSWQKRRPSHFKVEAENRSYKDFLGHLGKGDKKSASYIMAPTVTQNIFTDSPGPTIIRSSTRRSSIYSKPELQADSNSVDPPVARLKSLAAITETEEENKLSQKINDSIRKSSFGSSYFIEKTGTPMKKKSIFSMASPLLKTEPRSALHKRKRRGDVSIELGLQ